MAKTTKIVSAIAAGLIGLAAIVGTTDVFLHKKVPQVNHQEIAAYEVTRNGKPLKITRLKSSKCTNLKVEGRNEQGQEQTLYVFDEDNDGRVDNYGFSFLRGVKGSAFYGLSDEDFAPYLQR